MKFATFTCQFNTVVLNFVSNIKHSYDNAYNEILNICEHIIFNYNNKNAYFTAFGNIWPIFNEIWNNCEGVTTMTTH